MAAGNAGFNGFKEETAGFISRPTPLSHGVCAEIADIWIRRVLFSFTGTVRETWAMREFVLIGAGRLARFVAGRFETDVANADRCKDLIDWPKLCDRSVTLLSVWLVTNPRYRILLMHDMLGIEYELMRRINSKTPDAPMELNAVHVATHHAAEAFLRWYTAVRDRPHHLRFPRPLLQALRDRIEAGQATQYSDLELAQSVAWLRKTL